MKRSLIVGLILCTALMSAGTAEAHIVSVRLGDFFTGALHPLTDPVDWGVWIALSLALTMTSDRVRRWVVLTAPVALIAGVGLDRWLSVSGLPAWLDGAVLLFCGGALATARQVPAAGYLAAAAVVLFVRGMANAAGALTGADWGLYALGTAACGYVVVTLLGAAVVRGLGSAVTSGWRRVAIRVLGSWIAALGLMLVALEMRNAA